MPDCTVLEGIVFACGSIRDWQSWQKEPEPQPPELSNALFETARDIF